MMKKEILSLKVYEWLYLIFWCIFISILSFLNSSSIYALFSSLFGIIAVVLNIKNNRYAFIFYALYAISYGIIAFINNNYGEAILNILYNMPLYLYTIYKLFIKTNNSDKENKIKSLTIRGFIIIAMVIPLVTVIYGLILSNVKNSNLPFINALATGFAITSSFLASNRYKEQWYFWIGYSIVLIYIWSHSSGERVYLYLNAFYIISNLIGLYLWNRKSKK